MALFTFEGWNLLVIGASLVGFNLLTGLTTSYNSTTFVRLKPWAERHRPGQGATELVHTLNASGVAFPRTLIGLLEHYQEADSSVRLPEALLPYVGTDRLAPG